MKPLRSILAIVLFLVAFPGAPSIAMASSNHVERRRPPRQLASPVASAESEIAAPFTQQSPSHDGVIVPAAPSLIRFSTASRVCERRTPHRAPNLGDVDRCRDP